jgi:hypothetical protein
MDSITTLLKPLKDYTMLIPYEQFLFNRSIKKENSLPHNTLAIQIGYSNWPLTLPAHHVEQPVKQYPSHQTPNQFLRYQTTGRQLFGVCTVLM